MPETADRRPLRGAMALGGGLAFVASLVYFAERYWRGFDAPAPPGASVWTATTINLGLFSAFALHHSIFARTGLKAWLTRVLPPALERSSYVWAASLLFVAVCAAWQPVAGVAWRADGAAAVALRILQAAAAAFTLLAARHLDALDLAGVRQAMALPDGRRSGLDDHGPYGLVRHPIYMAWVVMVWAAPFMNGTRLVFAIVSTLYLAVAIPLEERDLRRTFGPAYDRYAQKVRWRMIPGVY